MHARIEEMLYQTDFDPISKSGTVIANITLIKKSDFDDALQILQYLAEHDMDCRIKVIREDTSDSITPIPDDCVGIATICSITCDGILLKHGINAAINIKNRYVRADCPELTPVEKGCMSNRYESGSPVTCSGEEVTVKPTKVAILTSVSQRPLMFLPLAGTEIL